MKHKLEFPRFAPWDAAGMARYLEAQEAAGWQFRGTGWLGQWLFSPYTPNKVRYAITYAPSRRNWRLTPTESERDLEDICFDAGWRKIAALSKFHIYRNPSPGAADLETDELVRLDTMDRSLKAPMLTQAVLWSGWSILILCLLGWAAHNDLPRLLAAPAIPGAVLFCIWSMAEALIPPLMYRRWHQAARNAARTRLPCPAVTGWRQFRRCSGFLIPFLFLWIISAGWIVPLLVYTVLFAALYGARLLLAHRVRDEALAEQLWQAAMILSIAAIIGLSCWGSGGADSPERETIPLMAQDLMDTSGLELVQFDMNANNGPLASYHNYAQTGYGIAPDLQYTVFDLRVPLFKEICEDQFLESFQYITQRDRLTLTEAEAALWGAEQVLHSTKPGQDQWLLFYHGRIVHLHANWNLTPEQIAAAAEKLSPREEEIP